MVNFLIFAFVFGNASDRFELIGVAEDESVDEVFAELVHASAFNLGQSGDTWIRHKGAPWVTGGPRESPDAARNSKRVSCPISHEPAEQQVVFAPHYGAGSQFHSVLCDLK